MISSKQQCVKFRRSSVVSVIKRSTSVFLCLVVLSGLGIRLKRNSQNHSQNGLVFCLNTKHRNAFKKKKKDPTTNNNSQEVRAEIIRSLKNTYVLTAIQQCCHSRKTSVEETDSDLQKKKKRKSLVSSVDRVSQDYKSPQGRCVPTIKRTWSFYCNLISDGSKGQLQCVFEKKKILITVSKLYSFPCH